MEKFFLIITIVVSITFSSSAQVKDNTFSKTISVSGKQVRIDSLLKIFSRQTGLEFSFNSNKISPSKQLVVPARNRPLREWLADFDTQLGITYKLVGNHIILVERKQATIKSKQTSVDKAGKAQKVSVTPRPVNTVKPQAGVIAGGGSASKSVIQERTFSGKTAILDMRLVNDSINRRPPRPGDLPFVISIEKDSINPGSYLAVPVKSIQQAPVVENRKARKSKELLPSAVQPFTKLDIGPQGVAISFERRLSQHTIIDFSLGLGGGYAITGQQFKYKVDGLSGPDIFASVNPRFYYNRQKRLAEGRSLSRNAGNYFGFRAKYVTDALAENFVVWDALLFNIHWGIQRPIGRRWVFNGHAGPGYSFATSLFYRLRLYGWNHAYPSFEVKLSYSFKKQDE